MKANLIILYAWLLELSRKVLMYSDDSMKLIFLPGFEKLRAFNGKIKMKAEYLKAVKYVPAYRQLKLQQDDCADNRIPETSKNSFVKKFSISDRCVGGMIPSKGIIIDESSGSSGIPTNWVRGRRERQVNKRFIQFGINRLFGKKEKIMINAFAMGSWATGINVSMASSAFSRVKSTGPEVDKIENTIRHFGTKEEYIVLGYPPFLKYFVDTTTLDLEQYCIHFIMGGEAMSEGLREYLQAKGIQKVISSYGASDLELNIGSENEFTINLRKLLIKEASLRKDLLIEHQNIPMIFQYNPADFYIETNAQDELLISVCRAGYVAPKIRYNIKDKGQTLANSQLMKQLKEHQINPKTLGHCPSDLPFLFHFGRSDQAVSFFGANISPSNIEDVIFHIPKIAESVHSFCITTQEDAQANKQLYIHLESTNGFLAFQAGALRKEFFEMLAKINQDFREALRMLPFQQQPQLRLHRFGEGPFQNKDLRIKTAYIQ
ncbi:MAG: hypothetical protein AAF849_02370 [Bacteroidota bacterium]